MENMPEKREPLHLDWDKLMPKGKDDDPPPELVIAEDRKRSPPPPESRVFAGMSEQWIIEHISRNKNLVVRTSRSLPDNGKKLRDRINLLEQELELRKLYPVNDDGHEKLMTSKRQNVTSTSGDFMEVTPPQSKFGAQLNQMLDESRTKSRTVNAFESEFSYFCHGGKSNAWSKEKSSTRGHQKSMMSSKQIQGRTKLSPFLKKKMPSQFPASKDSRLTSKTAKARNGHAFVLIDEEEPEELVECIEQVEEVDEEFDESMKDCKIYYPSREHPESVEVCYSDMQYLAPQAFLSSAIMNFYIRHLQHPTLATGIGSSDYYFFNTYFYSKLTKAVSKNEMESSFSKFRKWWKGVNIFQKAYMLLPIHENFHWSLVIICIPDKEDDLGPLVLHLDSLGLHDSSSIFDNVKSFLREEWKHLNQGETPHDVPISDRIWNNLPHRIDNLKMEVPQQGNDYDCGVFVLHFMELFIGAALKRLKRDDLAMFGRKWFKPEEASCLRQRIKKLLKEEFRKAREDGYVPAQSTQQHKYEQPKDTSEYILL